MNLKPETLKTLPSNPQEASPFTLYGGFPKLRGTLLGVPIIRIIVCWGLYWGPLFWETTISPPPSVALDLCGLSRIERRVDIFVEEGTTPLVTPGLEVVVSMQK